MIKGFVKGFDVGCAGGIEARESKNLVSAFDLPHIIDKKIRKEVEKGRIAGPFRRVPLPAFHISPLGVVPKKEPGSYRLIHHLSHPKGDSINDHIPDEVAKVTYQTIDTAIHLIKAVGRGAFLAKTDVSEAFRIMPVNPEQYHLFGMKWRGQFYFDKCLPMGCRSSCMIFERFSSALQWVAEQKLGICHVCHVLDDFLFIDRSHAGCRRALSQFVSMCGDVGVPIADDKTFSPNTVMTFLGYELDTGAMIVRLPRDKLDKCFQLIQAALLKPKITLKGLQSIIGTLNFACGVIVPGRAFLRRLIDLTVGVVKPFYFIRITSEAREDLRTWAAFLRDYNCKTLFLDDRWRSSVQMQLFTDAAGAIGYAGIFGKDWFQGFWNAEWRQQSIQLQEFYPIVVAVELWARWMENGCVLFYTDNESIAAVINKQSSHDKRIMWLLRRLVLICLRRNILFQAVHIPGKLNTRADLLSRHDMKRFRKVAPDMLHRRVAAPQLPRLPA